jgi:hypothetical protein
LSGTTTTVDAGGTATTFDAGASAQAGAYPGAGAVIVVTPGVEIHIGPLSPVPVTQPLWITIPDDGGTVTTEPTLGLDATTTVLVRTTPPDRG